MAIDPKKTMVKVKKSMLTDEEIAAAKSNRIEKTGAFTIQQKKMQANADTKDGKKYTENAQGIKINSNSLKADATEFSRKTIKFGDDYDGTTRIMSSDGKSVRYEGRNYTKATKDAIVANDKEIKDINSKRDYNANNYNRQSGAKKDLNDKDKESLVKLSKAVRT
jgi:hypothetical protein